MNISAIDTLEAILDGDTIVPGMSFVLPAGVGTTQYYNPSTETCTPDYTIPKNQIMLYPTNYSSANGRYMAPDVNSEQWFFDNLDSEAAQILTAPGGTVVAKYATLFAKSTYKVNNQTFPALKIIGNLASKDSLNDVKIYCRCKINGMIVTCNAPISIKETVGSYFDIVINCVNEEGMNDTVIDSSTEFLQVTADFQDAGVSVVPTGGFSWKRATSNGLEEVTHKAGVTELSNSNKVLKLFDDAIQGTEEYFCQVVHNSHTYLKALQVSDTHEPYFIAIGRNINTNLVKEDDTVVYTPSVLARSTRTKQNGWTFTFTIYDNKGAVKKSGSGATFTVTGKEVHSWEGTNVHIKATKA
ncbi:hypothetical protein EVA_08789 [gut metagenome]|uniref:Uncharacterized protein n=1 Tax=gut metagenome TaxID=749906 RepID=J9GLP7_9ZZZZ